MAKLTGAHLFIRCLKQEGIQKIFTIVGDVRGLDQIVIQQQGKAVAQCALRCRIVHMPL